eukprot:125310-Chlamydomonas_euryale.AAC.6
MAGCRTRSSCRQRPGGRGVLCVLGRRIGGVAIEPVLAAAAAGGGASGGICPAAVAVVMLAGAACAPAAIGAATTALGSASGGARGLRRRRHAQRAHTFHHFPALAHLTRSGCQPCT